MTAVDWEYEVDLFIGWMRNYISDLEGSGANLSLEYIVNLRPENVDAMVLREMQRRHVYERETQTLRRVIDAVSKFSGHEPNTDIRNLLIETLARLYPDPPRGPHNSYSNEPGVGPQKPAGRRADISVLLAQLSLLTHNSESDFHKFIK